jgi:H+/Cl- antiporter ClcA
MNGNHNPQNDAALMQVLAAACGVGTTIAFGTPVGGVLFSIEVTSSFYLVDNLWRSFFVAVCAESLFVISHRLGSSSFFALLVPRYG